MPKKAEKRIVDTTATVRQRDLYESVYIPLLELFAMADDVFTEANAFDPTKIHHSLGRLYRQWLDTREHLDPEFNRDQYRHEMKKLSPKKGLTPLGRKQRVTGRRNSSTGRTSISEKSQSKSGVSVKSAARKSAKGVRSDRNASGGQLRTQSLSVCGAAWLIANGSAFVSGSRTKAFGKFLSGTD